MGQGLYYHVMMMDDIANQLTEAVPPHRIFQEIGNFYRRGVVNYTIINVSDVRPVPLSLEAIMRFLWDPEPYVCMPPSPPMFPYRTRCGLSQICLSSTLGGASQVPARLECSSLW